MFNFFFFQLNAEKTHQDEYRPLLDLDVKVRENS